MRAADTKLIPARVSPPGRIIDRELEARGWSQKELADIMGRPVQAVNEIVNGGKQITPETAGELALAFGTSPEFWYNLETNYRLHLARQASNQKDNGISRRSRLYGIAPMTELMKRGWIKKSDSLDELESEVCRFYGIPNLESFTIPSCNCRCGQQKIPALHAQAAWMKRVEQLVRQQNIGAFDAARLERSLPDILAMSVRVDSVVDLPPLFMNLGIHFAVVPHLQKTYLDGAAWYIDKKPCIALTLRYDRIDSFWYTLFHEIGHILKGHQGIFLDQLDDCASNSMEEEEADELARNTLIPPDEFEAFIRRAKPNFLRDPIESFARQIKRHPGIVLGRLHRENLVAYERFRNLLEKVKPHLQDWIDVPYPA